MARVHADRLIEVFLQEYDKLELVSSPSHPRRPGVSRARYEKVTKELQLTVGSLRRRGTTDIEAYTDTALHIASYQFVTGATHASWRKWMALAAFGYGMSRDEGRARAAAALAAEWLYLSTLRAPLSDQAELVDLVLAKLSDQDVPLGDPEDAADEYDRACLQLAHSIPSADHSTTQAALETICGFWGEMAVYLHEPNPEIYPEFEPKVAALAAFAYRNGFRPDGLSPDAAMLLEPGLAGSESSDWYARFFSEP